jgi:hypothetical protein
MLFIDRKQINTRKALEYPPSRLGLRGLLFHIKEVFILGF